MVSLFNEIVNEKLMIRRISIAFANLTKKGEVKENYQLDLFSNKEIDLTKENEENNVQEIVINIKKKYGKNALLRGIDLLDGATTIERNKEIGGHKA